ncbi:hypothetical protein LTR08_002711 [Meristemomyces frigidus]|nr:hypothetical protein LTR08_002711 [Meristemomyces frigidus]
MNRYNPRDYGYEDDDYDDGYDDEYEDEYGYGHDDYAPMGGRIGGRPRSRPAFGAFDPAVDGGPRTPTLFSDHMIEEMAHDRGIALPRREIFEDEFLGQRREDNPEGELEGMWTDDYRQRPSLLNEPLPGGMAPTARETMPMMTRWGGTLERRFPGHNESMPEGTVGYVGRDEQYGWGHGDGPSMWPAEAVDERFVRAREADPDYSPPDTFDEARTRFPGDGRW